MADGLDTTIEEQPIVENELAAELRANMDLALGITQTEPIVAEQQEEQVEPTPFQFETFKERFGYEKPEDILTEIEELRALKATPKEEIKFENEDSRKLLEAFRSGKTEEVYEFLGKQKQLESLVSSEVTKDNAGSLIKLALQLDNAELTSDEIDYKFRKTYAMPKQIVQRSDEMDEEFEERQAEHKEMVEDIERGMVIDAKLAKPKLVAAKSNLVLPEIEYATDPEYTSFLQYKKGLQERSEADVQLKEDYKKYQPEQVKLAYNFKDEANKIDFNFSFEPDAKSFQKAVETVSDNDKFFEQYYDKDGNPDRKKFLEDVYFIQNKEMLIREAINQGKNATLKSRLADNSQNIFNRNVSTDTELSEFDKNMQMALGGYGNR